MFEGQLPTLKAGSVAESATTGSVTLAAAVAVYKNRVYLEHLSLGAAGKVTLSAGATQKLPTFFFAAKGTQFVGAIVESAVNEAVNLAATLDSAAGSGGVAVEVSVRTEVIT